MKLISTLCFFISFFCHSQFPVSPLSCTAPFYHGVASGDPLNDRVIIWTRVTPFDFNDSVTGTYRVASDSSFLNTVNSGIFTTNSTVDFTVKIDVTGLNANTFYFYEFEVNGQRSPIGRTKTIPDGSVDNLRFGVVSCANLESGYFNAYKAINERNDVDAVLMLGDYIYEYEEGYYGPNSSITRDLEPDNEIISLSDYRMRYSSYHLDRSLQNLHQNYPWICVWDDHEFANNSYKDGAENHSSNEGSWDERKENGQKAYFEWLPIRPRVSKLYDIYRGFDFGDLFSLMMLDTRIHGREEQFGITNSQINDTNRTMLGEDQFQWLKNALSNSTCKWKVLGNQVLMAEVTVLGIPLNSDGWDGYPAQRNKLYDFILNNNLDNFCVLTGDIHTSWGIDLKKANEKVGVEFITPSVTSPSVPINASWLITIENSHVKYLELTEKGFIILDVTPQKIQSDWYFVNTLDHIDASNYWAKGLYSSDGNNSLNEANSKEEGHGPFLISLMSECPKTTSTNSENNSFILGLYPNPVQDYLTIQFNSLKPTKKLVEIYDLMGNLIIQKTIKVESISGILHANISTKQINSGQYLLKLIDENSGNFIESRFIKQ